MKPVYYNQYDKPWNTFPYPSANHPKANVETAGCGVACYAMVHATLLNSKYTPIDGAKDAIALNDRGLEGTENEYFGHVAKKYNLPFTQTKDHKTAIEALRKGKLVVCLMDNWFKPGMGHFILAWGVSGNQIQIHDPASRAYSAKLWEQSVFTQKCIGYFIFSAPEKPLSTQDAIEILNKTEPPIITDKAKWLKKALDDTDIFYLLTKTAKYIKGVK